MSTSTLNLAPRAAHQVELTRLEALLGKERAERVELQREFDLRNCALDAATTQFMIIDISGPRWTIVYANRALAEDHGYEVPDLMGRSPAMLVPIEPNAAAFARIDVAVRAGLAIRSELVARRRDGSTFWVGMSMAPVRVVGGCVSHYVGMGADITAKLQQEKTQRQLQEQLLGELQERERLSIELRLAQKLESVGRLAAGVAHEINTPIQYIGDSVTFLQGAQSDLDSLLAVYRLAINELAGGNTPAQEVMTRVEKAEDAIDLEFLSGEIPKAFERTLQGVERVAGIVRAMKEFAHPDSVEHSSADLNHAIETTLTVAHNEYKYCAQIETRFGELPFVICNVGELNQVFLNLIVNAAHAISAAGRDVSTGSIVIVTSATATDVEITCTDNGCGIPASNLDRIFDPFFTTKPVGRGTGQGLAIARSIVVEKHGGSIDVHSVVGEGTRFVVRLPIAGHAAVKSAPA